MRKRGKELGKNRMSFRNGSQKERRQAQNRQAAVPHPLRTVPHLPNPYSTYLSHCISRRYRHDCSIHCESEIVDCYESFTYFNLLDRRGFPVEQWEEIIKQKDFFSEYRLLWRRADYRPITQYDTVDRYPTTPPDSSISYDDPPELL
jgi:hypothetical protein